jgi:K+-sensing histidine kinase KdpD
MNTHFAPHQRTSVEDALRQFHELRSNLYIYELIKALPYIASILDQNRQIVVSNDELLRRMNIDIREVIGLRPGEALKCVNSSLMRAGCGTSEFCQVCGAVNAILRCQQTGKTATDECRIRVKNNEGHEECLDLEVTATPFHWNQKNYIIFAARDISHEKRREALERIFFHDVVNTAGTLRGVVDLLKKLENPQKIKDFIDLLSVISQDLTEEILNQKSLLAAETGNLAVEKKRFYLRETLEHIVKEYRRHELARNREIRFVEDDCEITIHTDPVLLRRVVSNMIKNGLEAISSGETVTVDCTREGNNVLIRVHNPGTMPDPVRKQIFQRSFSTKGKGRGLGTYSMKLLGEKYLGGTVRFTSTRKNGTQFILELPHA